MSAGANRLNHESTPEAKIGLFRSLFRGRDDVYPRRFESRKTGKSGYAPACANEWVRGICEKPRVKCAGCVHREFLPVTDEVILWHLSGKDDTGQPFVAGVYPMLKDETCFFLAVDFDKTGWAEDAAAFLETCREMDLPVVLERSRSGRGGHVWLFFEESVPASAARQLGAHILTETMERHPELGFDSYDRFFPSQDTLPSGGFGNLIALPLQKEPREEGNSVFLDDAMQPYPDQWVFLSEVGRIDRARLEGIIRDAERRGRIVGVRLPPAADNGDAPWTVPPSRRKREPPITDELPKTLELVLGDEIYIAKENVPSGLRSRLVRLAAFQNPEFYKAQAMRLSTYGKPRVVACASDYPEHIGLPRGCVDDVRQLLSELRIEVVLRDERCSGRTLGVTFRGALRPEQKAAGDAMLAHETGVLAATTAFGKTVIAAWLIAERGVNTLVLVHRRQLLDQWVDRLSAFLDAPPGSIGRIGGGRRKPSGMIDVAVIQSLVRKGVVDDRVGDYGHLIVDECHHLPAHSFEQVARRAKARFVTGLSATVTRKDGHHPIILMQCGPVRYRVNARTEAARRPFCHKVVVRPTDFRSLNQLADKRTEFHAVYEELVRDDARNRRIADDVVEAVRDGRSPLVLTERQAHIESIAQLISERVQNVVVLKGGMGRKEQAAVSAQIATIPSDAERVLVATGRYIGEGYDDARLDTLFLTLPVSWRGTIAQYAGRLHRLYDGKREVRIYDYADLNVPMLARMFDRRCRGYEAVGYTVVLPGGALPGWPADVALPADPTWKGNYAASVRRLVRDGVDVPLARMFVDATGASVPRTDGTDGARSAAEAFLYRRLETLPETMGRFELNARLAIPFDGRSQMEVDFLCAESRVAVELDGAQHLADADAYRRDRRKDQLLQENGYLVLRFLAGDVAERLDAVLEAIRRVLVNRAAG